MLKLQENTVSVLTTPQNDKWLQEHIVELTELMPQDLIYYSDDELEGIISRMLVRADAFGIVMQNATIAFCYASFKFGIGFDTRDDMIWVHELKNEPINKHADIIWGKLLQFLEKQEIG